MNLNLKLKSREMNGHFDEEAWYECSCCRALMYGFQNNCWSCGTFLSYDTLNKIDLFD